MQRTFLQNADQWSQAPSVSRTVGWSFQIGVFSHGFHMNNLSMQEYHIPVISSKPNPQANQGGTDHWCDPILRPVWPLTREFILVKDPSTNRWNSGGELIRSLVNCGCWKGDRSHHYASNEPHFQIRELLLSSLPRCLLAYIPRK
jgi:hypothetical protein